MTEEMTEEMAVEMMSVFARCFLEIQIFITELLLMNYEKAKSSHQNLMFLFLAYTDVLKIDDGILDALYQIIDYQDYILPNILRYEQYQNDDSEEAQKMKKYYVHIIKSGVKLMQGTLLYRYLEKVKKLLDLYSEILNKAKHISSLSNEAGEYFSFAEV